jgi:hypothetical protein
VFWFPNGMRMGTQGMSGLPDLIIADPENGGCVWVELKTRYGGLKPSQEATHSVLERAGQTVLTIRQGRDDYQSLIRIALAVDSARVRRKSAKRHHRIKVRRNPLS